MVCMPSEVPVPPSSSFADPEAAARGGRGDASGAGDPAAEDEGSALHNPGGEATGVSVQACNARITLRHGRKGIMAWIAYSPFASQPSSAAGARTRTPKSNGTRQGS